jgi:hypothetical protein
MLKEYIFERLQDVEATKLAETVFNEIVFHKQREIQEEFKNWGIIDFNTPDGIKLDSFEGVFSLKVINKFASSFYSPSKNDKLIVLTVVGYDKYNDMVDNLIRIIIDKKSTFIHEFIHMLDDIRSDGKIIKEPTNKEGGQKRYEKLNREVNARFHQIASAVKEKYIDKEIASIKKDYFLNRKKFENEFDFEGLSEKEKLNLVLVNSSEYVCNINYLVDLFKEEIFNFFHYKLNPNLEKRLLSRAYTYFSELIKNYDIDCSKKIKTFYENKRMMRKSKINSLFETYKKVIKEIYNVPTEIELSDEERQFIKNIDWRDLIIEQENSESPINFYISIKGMEDLGVAEGIKVSFQIIGDLLYQIHINLAKSLQGLGLGYKIYKAMVYEFGHVYSGKGRQQNTEEVPRIWQKLSLEKDFICKSDEIGTICVLDSNPDKDELLNFLD